MITTSISTESPKKNRVTLLRHKNYLGQVGEVEAAFQAAAAANAAGEYMTTIGQDLQSLPSLALKEFARVMQMYLEKAIPGSRVVYPAITPGIKNVDAEWMFK